MAEFVFHWTDVNAAVAPGVLVLKGGYGLADFIADRDAIDAAVTSLASVDNVVQGNAFDRDERKRAARARIGQYRSVVLGLLDGTPYAQTLPKVPPFESNLGIIKKAMDEMANGWNRINTDSIPGFTQPLLLAGGYSLAEFNADIAALQAAYTACTNAEDDARQARKVRDSLFKPARARMLQYRLAVRGILPQDSPLLRTIPAFSPRAGATPDPVEASGIWNESTQMADLSWTASEHKKLKNYSIRTSPGPEYKTEDETVVGTAAKTETTFSTNAGLESPGATALYRVYVVLTTGNEKGSETVSVTRPGQQVG